MTLGAGVRQTQSSHMYWVKINPFYRFDLFHVVKLFQAVKPSLKDLLSDPYILIASGMFEILLP